MIKDEPFLLIASFPGSLIQFRGPLIDALLEAGKDVHVAVPDLAPGGEVAVALANKGVRVHSIPLQRTGLNPIRDLRLLLSLVALMLRLRPRFVLSYTIKPVVYGSIAAWLVGVKHRFALVTGLGYAFTGTASGKRALLRRLIQRLYRFALKRTHRVFFQNPDDEALFREFQLLPETVPSSVVNGSGVDVAEYSVAPLPDKPSFLLIARLLGDKGVREYAQAAQLVKAVYPEAVFRLVGWIDDNPDAITQREVDQWVDSGLLEFQGRLDDVRPAISDCSVYVLPSYREGTPRTVLEAMAMGRAVITTDAPGCRETVVDGDNGFLVPVKDVSALADAMMEMVATPGLAASMSERSRQVAEEKYDVHKVNAAMLEGMGIQ
ncbi:glycosyltransferase family 4 protein [Porticoccus hydrocarbonoclasticus]|jgi:glycosyltransferase involved in cell wall biosynthesis|uniref:glycosyltransferase family 4 protein n=1 Tax=Porticoccus hydrocarbonoclasticus TaxID=1073414 RepID=UPI0030EB3DE9|tara:strand:+ start:5888 stop:7021 length:1134 start_codon:yes stop_codon:yes gene_type:complete